MNDLKAVDIVDAITFKCIVCDQMFSICRSCWRGQKCCSKDCSAINYRSKRKAIQKRYAASKKGLESGRGRQRRRYGKIKSKESFSH
jgi:hypothetical protein